MDPEGDLQELPSSEEEEDDMDVSQLRGRLQKLAERGAGIESPQFTSPIGSPPDDSVLSAKGRFLELKRMMQQDKKSRRCKNKKSTATATTTRGGDGGEEGEEEEGFEEVDNPDDWEREGSISPASYHDDVDQLLESFRSERQGERDLSIVSHRLEHHPKMLEVCQQLREKDQSILSLESKVMELDRQVIDLQDTLSEKEKLLNSKNDAVNCMVAKYQHSIVERDQELSKTQETLFQLERKFGTAQETWKAEKERFNAEIKQQTQRLKDLDETNKRLEGTRVEQTLKEVELEEKLMVLKGDRNRLTQENVELEERLKKNTQAHERLVQELRLEVESGANKVKEEYEAKLVKMKKQFAIKLKTVKETAAEAVESQTIQDLQVQLKELQEKLGNKVEEVEHLTAAANEAMLELNQLKSQQMDNYNLIQLEEENSTLQSQLVELQAQLLDTSSSLQKDDSELTEALVKVSTLENKILELEEERGALLLVQDQLSQLKESREKEFNERLSQYEVNFEQTIQDYEKRIQEYETTNKELLAASEKSKEQLTKMKKQFQAKLKAAREGNQSGASGGDVDLQGKCMLLENRVAELEEEKGNNLWLQEELAQLKQEKQELEEKHATTMLKYQTEIEELKNSLEKSAEQVAQLENQHIHQETTHLFAESSTGDGWESQTRIEALEHQVAELEDEKGSGFLVEEDVTKLKAERELLENNFQEKSSQYEAQIQELQTQLTKSTEQMAKMKKQFQYKLRQLRDENKAKESVDSSASSSPLPPAEIEVELQGKVTLLENRVAELEEEKGNLLLQMVDFDEQQAQRRSTEHSVEETVRLEISLAEREEELRQVHAQLEELTTALSQKNGEVEKLMKNCSDMEHSMKHNVEELSSSVHSKVEESKAQVTIMEQQLMESALQLCQKEEQEQLLRDKLAESEMRFEEMKTLVEEYQGIVDGVRDHDKQDLNALKQELDSIREKAAVAENAYEAMKASYSQEISARAATISDLEQQVQFLGQELKHKSQEIATLREKKEAKESHFVTQIEILSAQLASYEKEIEQLRLNTDNLQTVDLQNTSSSVEFEEKEKQFKVLEQQLMDDIAAKNDQIQELNWQLENDKLETEARLAPLQEENTMLKTQLAEYTTYSESLRGELEAVKNYYANFESNYNQVYMELSHKSQQLEELLNKDNEQGGLISSLREQVAGLEGEKTVLQSQMEQSSTEAASLKSKLTEMTNEYIQLRESLESKDTEAQRLRQDADTLHTEYAHDNNELKLKISSLMDQLNECENEISVVSSRLKESDELGVEAKAKLEEVMKALEEKTRALEQGDNALFEKTEEVLKLEEKLRELEEKHRKVVEENFIKYSGDLDATYDQVALSANECLTLQDALGKREQELGDLKQQLESMAYSVSASAQYQEELNECKEHIASLENQLALLTQHFDELRAHHYQQGMRVEELVKGLETKELELKASMVELEELKNIQSLVRQPEIQDLWAAPPPPQLQEQQLEQQSDPSFQTVDQQEAQQNQLELQVKVLRIQELEQQVSELATELEELRNTTTRQPTVESLQIQSLWGPPPPLQQESQQGQDPFSGVGGANNNVDEEQLREKEERIYELEVQLAEMQINVEDINTQAAEVTELKTSLQVLQYKIVELEMENAKLKQELQQMRIQSVPLVPQPPQVVHSQYERTEPVEEPLIVASTAYVTTDSTAAELENAQKEIKELKIKNGKMIQRFKQLKDKFDAVVRENEGLKSKKEFSLDSAFEDEFMSQVKAKDALLEEKGKQLVELQGENQRLLEKVDLLERGTDRLTEMKEEQDRQLQNLSGAKRSLETEVSSLKWKVEELENISLGGGAIVAEQQQQMHNQGYFDLGATNPDVQENSSLRQQNLVLSQEVAALQMEIGNQRKSVDELNERNQQLEEEIEKLQELQIEQQQRIATPTPFVALNNQQVSLDGDVGRLQQQLQLEQQEKAALERKIELLQSKIEEIELSEIKCFEESLMLKSWTRQLELDNLKIQHELERIYGSIQDGDTSNVKVKVLQDEVIRLVDALQDRDKRCEQLTLEITRLLEERDTLQLKLSNVLRHNMSLHEEANKGKDMTPPNDIPSYDTAALQEKLAEVEQMNYCMGIDLRREREARRLVQEQLFFSSSSRVYSGSKPQSPTRPLPSSPSMPPLASPPRPQTPLLAPPPPPHPYTAQQQFQHTPQDVPSFPSSPSIPLPPQFQQQIPQVQPQAGPISAVQQSESPPSNVPSSTQQLFNI